jgi:HK97 family phage portal protein
VGILAQRLSDEVRSRNFLSDDDDEDYWDGRMTPAGVRVNRQAALSLTTVWRCVDLLSSAVAQAPKDIIVKVGGKSFPEFGKPSWLSQPVPFDPTMTINEHFAEVAASLLLDGNFFVSVFPYVFDPQVLTVLDPQRVRVRSGPIYELLDKTGQVEKRLGPMEMLHGTWIRLPGELRGISPLEAMRRGVGGAVAAEDFAGRFFGQGASLAFGVEVPGALDTAQKEELRQQLRRKYAGIGNSHAIGVLTGGAKFVSGLAPTPEQAQFLATRKFEVEDLCRPYGVPPVLAGSQEAGASSYASAYVTAQAFKQYAVLPLAVRIEQPYQRIVEVPPGITDPNAEAQFKFNLDGVARADLATRLAGYKDGIQGGLYKPNEARALEDLPPVDGGEFIYMQEQMQPLGQTRPIPAAPTLRSVEEVA